HEEAIDKLYKQLEVRESQLDESLMNANSQYNSTVQDLLRSKSDNSKLDKLIEELTAANRTLETKLAATVQSSEETARKVRQQFEGQIEVLQTRLEEQKQELAEKMDQIDNYESKQISEHKQTISQLESEIREKNT